MREAIEKFIADLSDEEHFCLTDDEWQFRDGTSCAICTSAAKQIAERFNGQVLGYDSINNPCANIGLPNLDGHDFALIDDRWLVDYWAWRVVRIIPEPILDLSSGEGITAARVRYGRMNAWQSVEFTPTPRARIASGTLPSSRILQGCELYHSHRLEEPRQ